MTSEIMIVSRNATTWTADKKLDEEAYRQSLQPFLDSRIIVFLASGGSGEANSLSMDELKRVYEIGVDVFKGTMPVYANVPETRNARDAIDFAKMAIDAGVDAVNFYGPASLHGYKPLDNELERYFDVILGEISQPSLLAPNPSQGYEPSPRLIADLANRHSQVFAVNLVGLDGDEYFLKIRDMLDDRVALNVPLPGALQMLDLGATGLICNLSNLIPKTVRSYITHYENGEREELGRVYAELQRFSRYVERPVWKNPRWQKMAMQIFGQPGGQGGVREPLLMPSDEEIQRFQDGLLDLGIAEIDELAKAAGLR
jgi:4-hydroxy-tetrahydrodipicolinate synthase